MKNYGKNHLHSGGIYAKLCAYVNTVRVEPGRRRRVGGADRGGIALWRSSHPL